MSKSYVDAYLRVTNGFFTDAIRIDPSLRESLDRDKTRLKSLSSNHGLALFTLILPEIDKLLCKSLDRCFLPISNLPLTGRVKGRSHIPRLFQGLWLKLFDENGVLRQDCDPTFVLILRSILVAGKKLEVKCSDAALYRTTKEFFDVESALPPASPIWDHAEMVDARNEFGSLMDLRTPTRSIGGGSPQYIDLWSACQDIADRTISGFGEFDPLLYRFRHGPGATAEYGRGKSYKYRFPTWQPSLETVFPYDMCGVSNPSILLEEGFQLPEFREEPSRLIAVPKTQKAPRLIAAEPAANQWCQQNVLSFILERMRSGKLPIGRSVDFRRQDLSGELALLASHTGHLATVDLKSASDRLSCWLVQRLWRSNVSMFRAIVACRTRFMRNTIDRKQASLIKLRKFATMGSALTFPIQSITFYIIALAAGHVTEGKTVTSKSIREMSERVRIYGDDLIVPVGWVTNLDNLLSSLFLKVNTDKTFFEGNFREACGVDAFRGYDVTPVKIRQLPQDSKPSTLIALVDTANLLHKKGLWYAARALRSLGDSEGFRIPVVQQSAGVWGDQTFSRDIPPPLRVRWNKFLQRTEALVLQPKSVRKVSDRSEGYENILQFQTEDPYDPFGSRDGAYESGVIPVFEGGFGRRWVSLTELLG